MWKKWQRPYNPLGWYKDSWQRVLAGVFVLAMVLAGATYAALYSTIRRALRSSVQASILHSKLPIFTADAQVLLKGE